MSDSAEKPFEATPRRIARAKREGNVARSSELAANAAFAAAALAVGGAAPRFGEIAAAAIGASLVRPAPWLCAQIVAVALLAIGCAALAGTLASLAQGGGLTLVPIAIKLERVNPLEGLRRMLSRETFARSLRAACAFACAALAMAPALAASAAAAIAAATPAQSAASAWSGALHVCSAACAVGLLFSIGEFGAARGTWLRKLRMSLEERKRELKEEEGDAAARGRRRALHRAVLRGGVPRLEEAAFVVVNPTHVAVALAYRPPRIAVPEVLVRAAGAMALRVREGAQRRGIPIVEEASLARALYRETRCGEAIPPALYVAVAEVVAGLLRAGTIAS